MNVTDIIVAASASIAVLIAVTAQAAEPARSDIVTQHIKTECTTKSTGGDGVRHDCFSNWTVLTAPAGYVINEKQSQVRLTSGNGSVKVCEQEFSAYVEVIPGTGIQQPTAVMFRSKALSPKPYWGGRGWAHCEAIVPMTKLPQ